MARHPGSASFHEIPLVGFSALATAGAGIGAARLLAGVSGGEWNLAPGQALLLSGLLFTAAVVSATHLGRPLRGHLALRGVGRSPLSNEILALAMALGSGALILVFPQGPWTPVLGVLACIASVMLLLALGGVYVLPGQVAWRGWAATSPLVMGVTWGILLGLEVPPNGPATPGGGLIWTAMVLDVLVVVGRWRGLRRPNRRYEVVHPRLFRYRGTLLAVRLSLSGALTPGALLSGWWALALSFYSAALLLDRFCFYALALRQTTESEVRRVEAFLEA